MPYVKVEVAGPITVDEKRAIHKGMTDVLVDVLGKNPEYVFVVIQEVSTDNWGRKGTSLTELWTAELPAEPARKPARKPAAGKSAAGKSAAGKAARRKPATRQAATRQAAARKS